MKHRHSVLLTLKPEGTKWPHDYEHDHPVAGYHDHEDEGDEPADQWQWYAVTQSGGEIMLSEERFD